MKKIEEETKQAKKHEGPVLVTDANFKKTVRNNPLVLIDFWDEWCGSGKAIAPKIEELSEKYVGEVSIGKIDIDKNPKKVDRFNVNSIPTLLLLKDRQEIDRMVGSVTKATIEKVIKQAFNLKPQGGK